MDSRSGIVKTQTWTFQEHELHPFSKGGVALYEDDDALEILKIEKVKNQLMVTAQAWIQIDYNGKIYTSDKKFHTKLRLKRTPKNVN